MLIESVVGRRMNRCGSDSFGDWIRLFSVYEQENLPASSRVELLGRENSCSFEIRLKKTDGKCGCFCGRNSKRKCISNIGVKNRGYFRNRSPIPSLPTQYIHQNSSFPLWRHTCPSYVVHLLVRCKGERVIFKSGVKGPYLAVDILIKYIVNRATTDD